MKELKDAYNKIQSVTDKISIKIASESKEDYSNTVIHTCGFHLDRVLRELNHVIDLIEKYDIELSGSKL